VNGYGDPFSLENQLNCCEVRNVDEVVVVVVVVVVAVVEVPSNCLTQ
jgi:hypothetical protein